LPVLLRLLFPLLVAISLAGCGSSSADPVGIGSGANDLKRSKCAGGAGSPCAEITTPPLRGPALDRFHDDVLRQIG
jgi:hypothetical protein